jgi:hypothetical protein
MVENGPVKPADGGISPYLQLPLRTHEKARQDREHRLRRVAPSRLDQVLPRDA